MADVPEDDVLSTEPSEGPTARNDDPVAAEPKRDALLAAPVEINDSLVVTKSGPNVTISWTDPPGPYNFYRGSVASGSSWAYNQSCFATSLSSSSVADPGRPTTGLSLLLVSRQAGGRAGSAGCAGLRRPRAGCAFHGTGLLPRSRTS